MIMIKKLTLLLLLFPCLGYSIENKHEDYDNWEFIVYDKNINFYYVNTSLIKEKKGLLTYAELTDYPIDFEDKGEMSHISLVVADCENKNISLYKRFFFKQRGGKGEIIRSLKPQPEWMDVSTPNTVGNFIISFVCEFNSMTKKFDKIKKQLNRTREDV